MRKQLTAKKQRRKAVSVCAALLAAVTLSGCGDTDATVEERSPILEDAFSENTDYVFKTVKNSGVNGDADVESRESSFADIRENITVEMTGFYREGDFIAEHVIISNFI